MLDVTAQNVWLAPGATDMRGSIDSLATKARYVVKQDPLGSHLFVFCNRGRDRLKILFWDGNGFWLLYKRLEKGRFRWPQMTTSVCISRRQLTWLLHGLEVEQRSALKLVDGKIAA